MTQAANFIWPGARIEICGPLGSGKSTLVRLLHHFGATPLYEPVEQHPYLGKFYENPQRYGLETNIHFVTHYLHSIKAHMPLETTLVVDSGLPLRRTYHDVGEMSLTERLIGDDLMDGIGALLPPADLYIHLSATTQQLLSRIARRGRDIESAVSADYVDKLNRRLDQHMARIGLNSRLLTLKVEALEGMTEPDSALPIIQQINRTLHAGLEAAGRQTKQSPLPLPAMEAA